MKKMCWFFGAFLMTIFLMSCGVNLNQNEAEKIITEHFGFPKPVTIGSLQGKSDSKFGEGVRKLIADGYVYYDRKKFGNSIYLPTKKGKKFIKKIYLLPYSQAVEYQGAVTKESLKSIDEILIDKESKVAIIKYTTKFEAIEPFYSAICVNERCRFFGANIYKENQKKIKLKKYDKGWKIPE